MSGHEKHRTTHGSHGDDPARSNGSTNGRDPAIAIDEQIRMRAYELYLDRGGRPDDDLGDWLQAEQELRGRQSADGAHS